MSFQSKPAEVVFLPGMLCDKRVWQPVWQAVEAENLGVSAVFVDYTDSSLDSMQAMAQRAIEASTPDATRIFAGFSMGGHIAFEAIRQSPDAVNAIFAACTGASEESDERKEERRRLIALSDDFARFDGISKSNWPKYVLPENLEDRDMLELVQDMARAHGLPGAKAHATALLNRQDSHQTLAELGAAGVPLVVCGSKKDQVAPFAVSENMARAHGAAKLVELNAGHLGPLEDADTVASALVDLIRAVSVT